MVEIIEWDVSEILNSPHPFERLLESAENIAKLPWNGYRVIKANTTDRKLYWMLYAALRMSGVRLDYLALDDEDVDWNHVQNAEEIWAFDIDNTLIKWDNDTWTPNDKIIQLANKKYNEGKLIVIWTSRSPVDWEKTVELLNNIGVKYDLLIMGKAYANVYIDDINVIHPDRVGAVFE